MSNQHRSNKLSTASSQAESNQPYQDFRSTECNKLIPQRSVKTQTDFIRTLILNQTLNELTDDINLAQNDYRNRNSVSLGLPLWYLGRGGLRTEQPAEREFPQDKTLLVGHDHVILPGAEFDQPPILHVSEQEILTSKAVKLQLGDDEYSLSDEDIKNLIQHQIIQLQINPEQVIRVRLRKARNTTRPVFKPSTQSGGEPLYSSSGSLNGLRLFLSEVGEDAAKDAFLADPRSGPYHVPSNTQIGWISGLSDEGYQSYLDTMMTWPSWLPKTRLTQAPPPPQYKIAFITRYQQTYELKGVSRGRLLESITLGPEESITTEIFTFDRAFETREEEREIESERSRERNRSSSHTSEIGRDVQTSVGSTIGGEIGLGLPVEAVQVKFGVNGQISTEVVESTRFTTNQLAEASTQAVEKFRATHQVKTLSRSEVGLETRVTRTFSNPNLGRTLHLHHFEILGNYETTTVAHDKPYLGVLVQNFPIGPFTRDWVRAHHDFLDEVLLHDAYREGLEAAQIISAQEWVDELNAAEKRRIEEERQRLGQASEEGVAPAQTFPNRGIFATARQLSDVLSYFMEEVDIEAAMNTLERHANSLETANEAEIRDAKKAFHKWSFWEQFTDAYPGADDQARDLVNTMQRVLSQGDSAHTRDQVISAMGAFVIRFDELAVLKVFDIDFIFKQIFIMSTGSKLILLSYPYFFWLLLSLLPDDRGLLKLITLAKADYQQFKAKQDGELLTSPAPEADKLQPSDIPRPQRVFSEKEIAEAHADLERLLLHLNAEETYYTNSYYRREDPATRIERLHLLGIADYVENRILGFSGTNVVYPLKHKMLPQESQDLLQDALGEISEQLIKQPAKIVREELVPTGGIQTETILGQCEALEDYLVRRRELDLTNRELQNAILAQELQNAKNTSEEGE